MRRHPTLALALLTSIACGGEAAPPDAEDAVAFVDGKADESGYSECELGAVVDHLNEPSTTWEGLRSDGLHTRAAKNLMLHRDGADGVYGTEDDAPFLSILEVDDVSWVGPVAISQLVAIVADRCVSSGGGEADVVFSPQPSREVSHLQRAEDLIDSAERSLDIAMYSFRDSGIQAALQRALDRGVSVRFIFESANGDRSDPEGTTSAKLEEMGIDVRYINKIMHHKFVIVDGPRDSVSLDGTLMTGSGNWSSSAATRYDENSIVISDAEALLRFQAEYELLWENSRDFVWNESLEFMPAFEIDPAAIAAADHGAVDAYFTSANFDVTFSSRYGPTFSVNRGQNEVADQIVALIQSAEREIRIASGHLRSRPISEALIAKVQENPGLDVRVYLDAQEFVSAYSHDLQVRDREECIVAAGSSEAQIADCYDRGFLYAYQLVLEGIDVRFKYYSYRWHYSYAAQMHHKYLIVDDTLITGSYNLSDNAEHNTMENVLVLRGEAHADLVQRFRDNFDAMYETARDTNAYQDLLDDVREGTDTFPIVFDSMALSWDEVDVLKSAMRDACSELNSTDFRTHPERHYTCNPAN